MRWESSKCTVISETEEEVRNDNLRFFLGRGEVNKATESNYLGMKMTRRGISETLNRRRGEKALQRAVTLAQNAKLNTSAPRNRTRYIINTYLRSTYM